MKKGFCLSLLITLIICSAGQLGAQLQVCSVSKSGAVGNGYYYDLWNQGDGTVCLTADGVDAQFKAQWTNISNFYGQVGLQFNSSRLPSEIGTISASYACTFNPGTNSYLGVHGSMNYRVTSPIIEYFIIENWGSWLPPGGTSRGTITVDDAEYNVYLIQRNYSVPETRIMESTLIQYWSVRKTKRTSGTISVSEHFTKWEGLGMKPGVLNDVKIYVEGYQSNGNAAFTLAKVLVNNVEPTPPPTPSPTPLNLLGDVNGDGFIRITDALLVAQSSAGMVITATFIKDNADVNKDGVININDALMIAQYSAGLRTTF